MGKFSGRRQVRTIKVRGKEKRVRILEKGRFEGFNPSVLGLGNIGKPSKEADAIAAVFDLTAFTDFCRQVDPHLAVPVYLSRFLAWLFDTVKEEFVQKRYKEGVKLWADLPFLAKFMGDGVLFLWDTRNMNEVAIRNAVISLARICLRYEDDFYLNIKSVVVEPPRILRCGIARGRVFSVGNGQDYVGPCINIASKLHKLSRLTFCLCHRGLDIGKSPLKSVKEGFVEKRFAIPGIGENELVWVLKEEFDQLPKGRKKFFREP